MGRGHHPSNLCQHLNCLPLPKQQHLQGSVLLANASIRCRLDGVAFFFLLLHAWNQWAGLLQISIEAIQELCWIVQQISKELKLKNLQLKQILWSPAPPISQFKLQSRVQSLLDYMRYFERAHFELLFLSIRKLFDYIDWFMQLAL